MWLTSVAVAEIIRAELPTDLRSWRQVRPWTTASTMCRLLPLLGEVLGGVQTFPPGDLTLRCFPVHLSPRSGPWAAMTCFLFIVSAKLSCALQCCDTHVFKWCLEQAAQELASQAPQTQFSRELLGKAWGQAFADCGLTGAQVGVPCRCQAKLGTVAVDAVGHCVSSGVFFVCVCVMQNCMFRRLLRP